MVVKRLLDQASAAALAAAVPPQAEPDELGLAPMDDEPGPSGAPGGRQTGPYAVSGRETHGGLAGGHPGRAAGPSLLEDELKPLGGATATGAGGSLDRLMADPMLAVPPTVCRWGRRSRGGRAGGDCSGGTKGLLQRKDVIEIKPVNPKQVKLVVIAWGVAVVVILGGLVAASLLAAADFRASLAVRRRRISLASMHRPSSSAIGRERKPDGGRLLPLDAFPHAGHRHDHGQPRRLARDQGAEMGLARSSVAALAALLRLEQADRGRELEHAGAGVGPDEQHSRADLGHRVSDGRAYGCTLRHDTSRLRVFTAGPSAGVHPSTFANDHVMEGEL